MRTLRWLLLMSLGAAASGCHHGPAGPMPGPTATDTVVLVVTTPTDTVLPAVDTLRALLHAAVVRWEVVPGADPRTLAADGRLPLVTHDPDALAYARAAPGLEVIPLPWNRVYALVSDSTLPVSVLADSSSAPAARADLARFSVAEDAIASTTPPAVMASLGCDSRMVRAASARPRMAYPAEDRVARQVAERLAALADLDAVPLDAREFGWALADGRDAGLILALSTVSPPSARPFCGARVTALIETRAALIRTSAP